MKKNKKYITIGAIGILFLYTIVIILKHNLGIDELDWTLFYVINKSWKELFLNLASYGYNLPLYYMILKCFFDVFHYNEFMLLLPSTVMAFIGVYYIYKTSKKFFKTDFSVLTIIVTLSSLFFFRQIAVSIRPYGLLFMLSSLSFYLYLNKLENHTLSNNIKYILSIILLLFTHWYGAIVVFFYGITDLYLLLKRKLEFKYFILYIIPFISIVLWFVYILNTHINNISQYWAENPTIISVIYLIFIILNLNSVNVCLVLITNISKKSRLEENEDKKKIRIILFYIIAFISIIYVYSSFINSKASLWVNRYFIAIVPQIVIVSSFYIYKAYIGIFGKFLKYVFITYLLLALILNLLISYIYPHYHDAVPYIESYEYLKENEDIFDEDTLIIYTLGNYWFDYYFIQQGERFPANLAVIDSHKCGNGGEKAKIDELEYVVKNFKTYNKPFKSTDFANFKKIYIVELHRLLNHKDLKREINLDNCYVNYNKSMNIIKIIRNED